MSNRYAYLGPEGTFTEAALRALKPDAPAAQFVPCNGVDMVFAAVRRGEATGGVVPLENSVEGGVSATTAELVNGDPLLITAEIAVAVEFTLFARRGTALPDVKRVATHSHALAQCRGWLAANLPDAEAHIVSSTAAAAQSVAEEPSSPYDAAICARIAGERYGLVPLAEGVGDRAEAATRFIYLSRPGTLPEPTGADRTSLVAFLPHDHPGALVELLTQFAVRDVNLTRLESRPTGDGLGTYCFFMDADGHVAEARVGEALMGLRRICKDVRFLGSYPRADAGLGHLRPAARISTTNDDFHEAEQWLARIRAGRVG
ncbi:prephenate dehydratase [Thermobifida halotolerans]|uniref:Prephenate dehydratase n=1 Tax=Thermobifida halotolerans TaxID=483545 RepID=A0A399FYY3_9ACTN|nr:prephenate dehydratase [Thermobifida halotolerans]UOE18920.1 prephenate dehydratase [Thermobifida halotolerans]